MSSGDPTCVPQQRPRDAPRDTRGLRTGGVACRPCGGAGRAAADAAGWKLGGPDAPRPPPGWRQLVPMAERRREGGCTRRAGRARLSRAPRSTRHPSPRHPSLRHPSPITASPITAATQRRGGAGPTSPAGSPCGLPASPAGFRGPPFVPRQRAVIRRAGFRAGLVLALRGVRGAHHAGNLGGAGAAPAAWPGAGLAPEGGGSARGCLSARTQHVGRRPRSRGAEGVLRSPYGSRGGVRGLGS